jgi:formate dehydrogenase major subunit
MSIAFTLDGREIIANEGETILQAAERYGYAIPHLCYTEGMRPDGNCRACVVEIKGERVLAPSCARKPITGMEVSSKNDRARHSQRMVLELLMADAASSARYRSDSELIEWAHELNVGVPRFEMREQPAPDLSHPGIQVHLDACIQCTRCVRACREVQVNDVIGYAYRGSHALPVFDLDDAMGASTCVACGECVQACPTGAILPKLPSYVT